MASGTSATGGTNEGAGGRGTDPFVDRLARGDLDALAELFALHRQKLLAMVRFRLDRRLRARVAPSDVLQDAYLDAASRVDHFLSRQATMTVFTWLRLIVGQRLNMIHRQQLGAQRRDARREVALEPRFGAGDSVFPLVAHLAESLTTPSQALQRAELVATLEEGLRALDPIDCEILALRHFEDLGNNDAAEILGLSKAAASNRYVRALGRLRKLLDALPGTASGEAPGGPAGRRIEESQGESK